MVLLSYLKVEKMTLSKYTNILPLACQNFLYVSFLIFLSYLCYYLWMTLLDKKLNDIVTCKSYHNNTFKTTYSPDCVFCFLCCFYSRKTMYAAFMTRSPQTLSLESQMCLMRAQTTISTTFKKC